jgi:hypothetical protein
MSIIFIIAISFSIILFAGPDLRFRGHVLDQVTGALNYIKITMFYFWGPFEHSGPVRTAALSPQYLIN